MGQRTERVSPFAIEGDRRARRKCPSSPTPSATEDYLLRGADSLVLKVNRPAVVYSAGVKLEGDSKRTLGEHDPDRAAWINFPDVP